MCTFMSFIKELWEYITVRKKFWLLPLIIISLLLGFIVIAGQGSPLTPFIYAIF